MIDVIDTMNLEPAQDSIIKVMGVGGGGCNVVNNMFAKNIKDVSFLICNTDKQALGHSSIPAKLQLGPGLGAGGQPEIAHQYAEENRDRIHEALNDGTKMLFLIAGMGGGTGTGASSVVAQVAKEMNILTVGIVTIPFAFEGLIKIRKAMTGVAELANEVDALLVVNNEKLKQIYPDISVFNAFSKSDEEICNSAKAIAEIITIPGYINTDFADVYNTLKNGKVAIMNVGEAQGEERITHAIENALHSPLVNTQDVRGAKRVLLQFYCSSEHAIVMSEIDQIHQFVSEVGEEVEVQWGASIDEEMGENVRVTVIATGYEVSDISGLNEAIASNGKKSMDDIISNLYGKTIFSPKKRNDPNDKAAADVAAKPATPTPPENPKSPPTLEFQSGIPIDDVVIEFDEAETQSPTQNSDAQNVRGWLRGKKY